MIRPTYEGLKRAAESGYPYGSRAMSLHPNPRFYKYTWHVFWRGSPVEGHAFLETEPLSTKAAFDLLASLRKQGEPFIVFSHRHPRCGVSIWDLDNPRWNGARLAPSYDDDNDPPIDSGHR
jgi:hypothetical protein